MLLPNPFASMSAADQVSDNDLLQRASELGLSRLNLHGKILYRNDLGCIYCADQLRLLLQNADAYRSDVDFFKDEYDN